MMETARLVFVDETAARCSMNRLYGWARSGATPLIKRNAHGRGRSVVGAIAADGLRAQMTYAGTMNGDRMVEFINDHLGPSLQPGDIVVMDGLRVHRMRKVRHAIERFGTTTLILPPYSPELNPIEHAWSTLKARLRAIATQNWEKLQTLVVQIWNQLGPYCAGWVNHCGYAKST